MIYLRREINIVDGVSQFEKLVTLKKGDNDIDLELKINGLEVQFRDNIIFYRYALIKDGLTLGVHENQAKNGILCINLTDLNIGEYSIAIQLIDSEKDSKISIPLIENIIEVIENAYDLDLPVEPDDPDEPVEPEIKQYTIIFIDYDGAVLGEFVVNEGDTVTPPVPGEREGFNFIGWNKDFSSVNSDLFIIAQYEEIESDEPGGEPGETEPVVFTPQTIVKMKMDTANNNINYPAVYKTSSTNRCFDANIINVKEGYKYKLEVTGNVTATIHQFNHNNQFIEDIGWLANGYEYVPHDNCKFFILYFKMTDGSDINEEEIINNVKLYEIPIEQEEPVDPNFYLIKNGVMLEEFTIVNDTSGNGFIEQNDGYFKFYNTSTASSKNMSSLVTVKKDYNWADYKEIVVEFKAFSFPWSWDKTFKVRFNGYTKTYKENEYVVGDNIVSMVDVGINLESTHVDLRIPPQNSYVEIINVYLVPFD